MSEPKESKTFPELENKLNHFYQDGQPQADFADRLEAKLVARASALHESSASLPHRNIFSGLLRRPLLAGAMAVLLFLIVAIGIIGPQKVLAEVQRLFGYLPGYGFVQANQVRVLAEPVVVQQEGAVLTVTNVVAESRQTIVTFNVTGLSPKIFNAPSGNGKSPVLLFPDGREWMNNQMGINADSRGEMSVSIQYPPLPQEIDQVTLVMTYLPGLPAWYAPENWSIPLTLAERKSISPYMPQNASASDQGVTVSVLQVAQSGNELGLQVQYSWKNPAWLSLQGPVGMLKDENGQQIPLADLTNVGSNVADFTTSAPGFFISPYRYSLPAEPVKKFTLTFDQMWFDVEADAAFTFDPNSSNPEEGQTWDLSNTPGMDLVVAGVPVKILSAKYDGEVPGVSIQAPGRTDSTKTIDYRLSFICEVKPTAGFSLQGLKLSPSQSPSGSGSETMPNDKIRLHVDLRKKPGFPITLKVESANLVIYGKWQIEWVPPHGQSAP